MDRTTLEHALLSAIFTLLGFILGDIHAGATFSIGYFTAREMAQSEYRWIEKNGGLRSAMPWYIPFLPRSYDAHSVMDMVAPAVVVVGMCLIHWYWM